MLEKRKIYLKFQIKEKHHQEANLSRPATGRAKNQVGMEGQGPGLGGGGTSVGAAPGAALSPSLIEDVTGEGQVRPGSRTDRTGLLQGDACCGFGPQGPTKPVGMRARIQRQSVPKRPLPHL